MKSRPSQISTDLRRDSFINKTQFNSNQGIGDSANESEESEVDELPDDIKSPIPQSRHLTRIDDLNEEENEFIELVDDYRDIEKQQAESRPQASPEKKGSNTTKN